MAAVARSLGVLVELATEQLRARVDLNTKVVSVAPVRLPVVAVAVAATLVAVAVAATSMDAVPTVAVAVAVLRSPTQVTSLL